MIIQNNQQFLQAIFGDDWTRAHVCQFPQPPDSPQGGSWMGMTAEQSGGAGQLEMADWNQYYTVSLFKLAADGASRRTKDLFEGQYALVLDDLGDGPGAKIPMSAMEGKPLPQYAIETSPRNWQIIYIFERPVVDADLLGRVIDALIHQGLSADADPGFRGVTRYVRLPFAINNKIKYDEVFPCRLMEVSPDTRVSLGDIVVGWGLEVAKSRGMSVTSTPVEVENSLSYQLLSANNLWTGEQGAGWWGVPCPNQEEHTIDDGRTALNVETGVFKCMHGSCEGLNRGDLESWLVKHYGGQGVAAGYYFGEVAKDEVTGEEVTGLPGVNDFIARAANLNSEQTAEAIAIVFAASKSLSNTDMDILYADLSRKGFKTGSLKADLKIAEKASRGLGVSKPQAGVITGHLAQKYLFITEKNKFFNVYTKKTCSADAINREFVQFDDEGSTGMSAADRFSFEGGVSVQSEGWRPWPYYGSGDLVLNAGSEFAQANSYLPPPLVLAHSEDAQVEPWLRLFKHLVPDEKERGIFMDWMALTILRPDIKIQWGILFIGEPGLGKDALLTPMVRLLGENASEISRQDAKNAWGDARAKKKLLVYQEVLSDDDMEFENGLKTIIAGTAACQDRLNMKGSGQVDQENLYSVVGMSNYWSCLHLEPGDRRWFAISCMDFEKLDDQFYIDYHTWLKEGGGIEAVCGWLINRDLRKFNYAVYPYHTDAYHEIVEAGRSNAAGSIVEAIHLEQGVFSQDLITLEEVKKWYGERHAGKSLNNKRLTLELKTMGVRRISTQPREWVPGTENMPGKQIAGTRLFSVRNHELYKDLNSSALYSAKVAFLAGKQYFPPS